MKTTISSVLSRLHFRIIRSRLARAHKLALRSMVIERDAMLALGRHIAGEPS